MASIHEPSAQLRVHGELGAMPPHTGAHSPEEWVEPSSPSRVSSLKKAVDQRNQALKCLNEAMNVSCALLSSKEGPRPISCTTSTAWSRLQQRDVFTATCVLENHSAFSLGRGWALCIQVGPSVGAWELDTGVTAVTYTVPVDQLEPGGRREVTLPLAPGEDNTLGLPLTVACALFYSLREVVGGALAPSDPFREPCVGACLPSVLPKQEGICLPLSEHTVDLLQGLRFPGLAMPPASLLSPAPDPVDNLLGEHVGGGTSLRPASLRARYLPPSLAAIRVSAELLRTALQDGHSGGQPGWGALIRTRPPPSLGHPMLMQPLPAGLSLCSATLQWLLAENTAVDLVKAQALSSIQGVAPDGTDVHLTILEASREQGSLPSLGRWALTAGVLSRPSLSISGGMWGKESASLIPKRCGETETAPPALFCPG